ncbi:hypothetical protein N3K66_008279 [Trichothecium roseum]|uniref:Uncharacterized protein n=1 Tax=Trichothecium roseum TaxID=47278 RepID=A0ACC0UVK3_9HYPO|nr:hypothetical protein N3K66_008279 [Trichothecium roseum]
MAPNPAATGGLLRQVIHYHLDNASYENALFFSERYVAQDPKSAEAAYLTALSHLRLRDFRSSYDVSKPLGYRGTHLGCAWVFAQVCLALDRFKDGISALEKSRPLWPQRTSIGKHDTNKRPGLPDASSLSCLLGKLYRGLDDQKKAISCFEEALKLNPFMWDAFTILCDMGVVLRVPNIFRSSENLAQAFDQEVPTSPREGITNSTNELVLKKSSTRHAAADWGADPFSTTAMAAAHTPEVNMYMDHQPTDFMSKVEAARVRHVAPTNGHHNMDTMETPPAPQLADVNVRSVNTHEPPQAPPRRTRTAQVMESGIDGPPRMNYRLGARRNMKEEADQRSGMDAVYQEADPEKPRSGMPGVERKRTVSGHPVPRAANVDEPATRRSARLNNYKPTTKVNSGTSAPGVANGRELKKARPPISRIVRPGSSGSNVGRVVSGNRKPIEPGTEADYGEVLRPRENLVQQSHKPVGPECVKIEEALKWSLDLLKKLGSGYYYLSRYMCDEALQALGGLPAVHQSTPWVLAQMGRAHYEQTAYPEAEKFFRKMRVQAPSRLEDMEVYSTVLWHLKRETDLSFLAHELVESAWHSPQAWCAVGNAWSLARDPEQALRCFKRATQLDPKFAYAFTLQGHEHVANEEYDKALTAYRHAIAADRRHYNAYYGIGRVQERLGAYDKAYMHFHAAQNINPSNAVLVCCIGTVMEKQKQIVAALHAYTRAVELAPRAAQTRYKKARALLAVGQIESAQKELMILKDLAPDEGTVHFLLGTLYRSMHDRQSAVRHFTIALALDPKAGPKIKEAIESFEDDVQMDDSMIE